MKRRVPSCEYSPIIVSPVNLENNCSITKILYLGCLHIRRNLISGFNVSHAIFGFTLKMIFASSHFCIFHYFPLD